MTIREIAEANGVSVQSIYKKLKSRKINVATLKKDNTGQLTEAGEKQILELLKAAPADSTGFKPEVERLKTQVEMLEKENAFLKDSLQREQAVSAMALQRIALPAPEHSTGFSTRLKRWFKKGSAADGNEGK